MYGRAKIKKFLRTKDAVLNTRQCTAPPSPCKFHTSDLETFKCLGLVRWQYKVNITDRFKTLKAGQTRSILIEYIHCVLIAQMDTAQIWPSSYMIDSTLYLMHIMELFEVLQQHLWYSPWEPWIKVYLVFDDWL